MGEDFQGQKRQQEMFQYSMAGSFAMAVICGWASYSFRTGCYAYLVGLVFTWLTNVVEWDYFFNPATSWAEGKYLDVTGYWDLEARDRMAVNQTKEWMPKQRSQITLSGGPARMTISSRPLPDLRFCKKWSPSTTSRTLFS